MEKRKYLLSLLMLIIYETVAVSLWHIHGIRQECFQRAEKRIKDWINFFRG